MSLKSKSEERDFRLRPRKPPVARQKPDRVAWAAAFKAITHFARTSRVVKAGRRAGNGGKRTTVPRSQRCAVRVTYASNGVRGHWRAHGRYVARESAATEPTAAGFDQGTFGIDLAARLHTWQAAQDRRLWKMIISPEFGERVDSSLQTEDLGNSESLLRNRKHFENTANASRAREKVLNAPSQS